MEIQATLTNMREHYRVEQSASGALIESTGGVIAWSPATGEECSANPADYFWLGEDTPLLDSDGEPMILVRKETRYVPVGESV